MTTDNNNIDIILGLHFSGERLTDEQEKVLVDWITDNKDEYRKLTSALQSSGRDAVTFDAEKAWTAVKPKLVTKRFTMRRIAAYAASLVLIACISLFYFSNGNDEQLVYSNTTDEIQSVVLPDSSEVKLYPSSQIKYIADAAGGERKTELSGKAYFKIRPDHNRPFKVKNNKTTICVLGTSFIVNGSDTALTEIYVREGRVMVTNIEKQTVLVAGEHASVINNDIKKTLTENADSIFSDVARSETYDGTPLYEVLRDIETEFNIKIDADRDITNQNISTTLKFISIEDILSEISFICNCQYIKISDKQYKLYKP